MKKVMLISIVLCLVACGCEEQAKIERVETLNPVTLNGQPMDTPSIKPMADNLIPMHKDWVALYGDTYESQVAYNLALIRFDQQQVFRYVNALHPPVDPNEATLESRVAELEKLAEKLKKGEYKLGSAVEIDGNGIEIELVDEVKVAGWDKPMIVPAKSPRGTVRWVNDGQGKGHLEFYDGTAWREMYR